MNHYYNCYPQNIFDTQIAYNLLTSDVSISYSNLVKKYFNPLKEKGNTAAKGYEYNSRDNEYLSVKQIRKK